MKTKIYLTLLSLVFYSVTEIHAQSNSKILADLDKKPDETETLKTISETSLSVSQKTVAKSKSLPNDHTSVNYNLKANTAALQELLKQSEELTTLSQKLRAESKDKHESVKKILLSEANNLDRQTQLVQVAASELSAEISYYKFDANKTSIKKHVSKTGENNVPQNTKNLIFDSEKIIRLAKEMREEANAQPNLAAKLGTMGNAEEQEALALSKQVEALNQLEKATYTLTAR